jgi:hypothetical protein
MSLLQEEFSRRFKGSPVNRSRSCLTSVFVLMPVRRDVARRELLPRGRRRSRLRVRESAFVDYACGNPSCLCASHAATRPKTVHSSNFLEARFIDQTSSQRPHAACSTKALSPYRTIIHRIWSTSADNVYTSFASKLFR